jgi:predicted nucleic acid-binding protein
VPNVTFTLDTNLLVYSVDHRDPIRHTLAVEIVRRSSSADCLLTLQAVSEFYAVLSRKRIIGQAHAARLAADWLDLFRSAPPSATAIRLALDAASTGRASYWDALLIATAAEAGCSAILTEELSHGTTLFGVRIVNPFAGDGLSPEADRLLTAA